jgi:hypothetical protein
MQSEGHPVIVIGYSIWLHCKEIWIYVFQAKELRALSPNFQRFGGVTPLFLKFIVFF